MPLTFEIEPEVFDEVRQVVSHYDSTSQTTSGRFLAALRKTYDRIERQPRMFGRVIKAFRAAPIKRFPYFVIYRLTRTAIRIVAIHHGRKGSFEWLRRGL
jgi:plasmid stabilization system protein ParE